jgi:hypothetical protein
MIARIINNRGRRALPTLVAFLAIGLCTVPVWGPLGQAQARGPQQERGYQQERGHQPGHPQGRPAPGFVNQLPPGHGRIQFKGHPYYYHGGRYYRPHGRGYVVVTPPRRMIVPRLPLGFATLVLAGITYFTFMGIYYQRVPTGYMIVAPPAGAPAPPPAVGTAYATVTVTAAALNVRQGPGAGYPVLFVVNLGETLSVLATAPGWLFVQNATGQQGWVDQRFTSPLAPGASG